MAIMGDRGIRCSPLMFDIPQAGTDKEFRYQLTDCGGEVMVIASPFFFYIFLESCSENEMF